MLLDTASLYFRAFYGVPDTVRAPDGTPVNAVRGLLDSIAKLVGLTSPTHLVACWDDDWRPQWRVDLIPTYKAHRVAVVLEDAPDVEEVPDPLEMQVPIIREALARIGARRRRGRARGRRRHRHARDELRPARRHRHGRPRPVPARRRRARHPVVYTAGGMSKLEIVTDAVIHAKYGVHGYQYADYATLRGDASDGLPGVAGIGEKTAAALLDAHGSLPAVIAAARAGVGMSAGQAAKVLAGLDYLAVAPRVVEVVRELRLEVPDARIRPIPDDEADLARFARSLARLLRRSRPRRFLRRRLTPGHVRVRRTAAKAARKRQQVHDGENEQRTSASCQPPVA